MTDLGEDEGCSRASADAGDHAFANIVGSPLGEFQEITFVRVGEE